MTRSLSSPNAVERNQTAPSSSYTCPCSRSRSTARATQPSSWRRASLVHTSNRTPSPARLASIPSRTRPAAPLPPPPPRAAPPPRADDPVRVCAIGRCGGPHIVGQRLCQIYDVLAVVAVIRHGLSPADRRDRRSEVPDLPARVVEVVLAGHALTARFQNSTEHVADERAAGIADVEWSGRVGGHELDVDRALGLGRQATPSLRFR